LTQVTIIRGLKGIAEHSEYVVEIGDPQIADKKRIGDNLCCWLRLVIREDLDADSTLEGFVCGRLGAFAAAEGRARQRS
jgi:hypothetical protein